MDIVRRTIEMTTPCPILLSQTGALLGYSRSWPRMVCMPHYPVEITDYTLPALKKGEIASLSEEQLVAGDIPEDYGSGLLSVSERRVRPLTFYCDSVSWDDTAANADDMVDKSGDGSRENPWRNVNYAIKKLSCLLSNFCGYARLCVKGVVDYRITVSNADVSHYSRLIVTPWNDDENRKQEINLDRIYNDGKPHGINVFCILSGFHIKITGTGIVIAVYRPSICMNCEVTFEDNQTYDSYTAYRGDYPRDSVFYRCTANLKNVYSVYGFYAYEDNIFYDCSVHAFDCKQLYGYYSNTGSEKTKAVFYLCILDAVYTEYDGNRDIYGFWGNTVCYRCSATFHGNVNYLYGFYNSRYYETMANASAYYSCKVDMQAVANTFYGFFTSHNAAIHCKVVMTGTYVNTEHVHSHTYRGYYTATCYCCSIEASVASNQSGELYGVVNSRLAVRCTADMTFSVRENSYRASAECIAFHNCDNVYNCSASVSASASATPDSGGIFRETEQACGFYDSSGCHDPCHYVYRTQHGIMDYCNS